MLTARDNRRMGKGTTLRALAIVVILILAYTSAVAYSQYSGYIITVQTDRPYYYVGDRVYISGTVTYNNWPQQRVSVTIFVTSPNGGTSYFGTTFADSNGNYSRSFTLSMNAQLGTYVVSVSASSCTNQTTFQVITEPFHVPVTPLGTLAAIVTMFSILGIYIILRKGKL